MTKILVIEDEAPVRKNIAQTLTFEGYQVIEADNGEDGIQYATNYLPDLIICDIIMDGLNGFEVLSNIREISDTSIIPFIFLTANTDKSSRRTGMRNGANDFLEKPFEVSDLLGAVEARLKERNALYQDVEETKRNLLRTVTHELRTPLSGIVMATDYLSGQLDSMSAIEINQMLKFVQSGSNRMHHLVEQMILKSLIDSKKMRIDTDHIDFVYLVVSAINLSDRYRNQNKGVTINLKNKADSVGIGCYADSLRHAITEILLNAVNYSKSDGLVDVEIWTKDGMAHIKITDKGLGMSSSEIAKALHPFEQIGRDQFEQQGIGLGLWLADQIVQLHHGKLDIKSGKGTGTTVYIELPYVLP